MDVGAVYRDESGRRTVFNVWMWELGIGKGVEGERYLMYGCGSSV